MPSVAHIRFYLDEPNAEEGAQAYADVLNREGWPLLEDTATFHQAIAAGKTLILIVYGEPNTESVWTEIMTDVNEGDFGVFPTYELDGIETDLVTGQERDLRMACTSHGSYYMEFGIWRKKRYA